MMLWRGLAVAVLAGHLQQKPEPLRKTDLIRLLSGGTMSSAEIADLVKHNCVSFTPTPRDRENLSALGADSTLLAGIDACLRAHPATSPRPAPRTPVAAATGNLLAVPLVSRVSVPAGGTAEIGVALKRGGQVVSGARLVLRGSAELTGGKAGARDAEAVTDARGIALFRFPAGVQPGTHRLVVVTASGEALASIAEIELATVPLAASAVTVRPAAARTGFVAGNGQRGVVGEHAALSVIFEVRDSQGGAIAKFPVEWAITNGQLVDATPTTDSGGRARAGVIFGERAAPTVVTVAAGEISKWATLYAHSGPPARLVVERGGARMDRVLLVASEGTALLRVYCRDGYDNPVPLEGLVAVAGDDHIVRVTAVTTDSAGGWVTLRPGKDGVTNLTLHGSGVRAEVSATVQH